MVALLSAPGTSGGPTPGALLDARARVVHDLAAHGLDAAAHVDAVDAALRERRWWLEAWPEGAEHVAGQVAQDVQESLADEHGVHWPRCSLAHPADDGGPAPAPHVLHVLPDLGPDPHWVCEESGAAAAPLGALPPPAGG